jgi:hypothetical protein
LGDNGRTERLRYLVETPSALLYLLSVDHFPLNAIRFYIDNQSLILQRLRLDPTKFFSHLMFASVCHDLAICLNSRALSGEVSEIRSLLGQWSSTFPASLVMNCFAFFVKRVMAGAQSTEDWTNEWNRFKPDLVHYISFMEALYYYCSKDEKIRYAEFFPKIEESFLTLSPTTKSEGLEVLRQYAANTDRERKNVLEVLISKLTPPVQSNKV